MVDFSAIFILAFSLSTLATPIGKRTVAQVEADIAAIATDVNALDLAVNGFPDSGGSLTQALVIHTDASRLASALSQGTTDIKNTPEPVSEADGNTILSSVEVIQPTIIDALNTIIAKKPAFDALPIGGVSSLVKSDLTTLCDLISDLEDAIIAMLPPDLVPRAMAIKVAIDAACRRFEVVYADT